jgi:hypothetical protein
LLEAHLEDCGALIPQPNPNYVPPKTEWRALSACDMTIQGGVMKLRPTGMPAQVESPTFSLPGPAKMTIRARCPQGNDSRWQSYAGRPRVFWSGRGGGEPSGHQLFDVPYTGEWTEVDVPLPTQAVLGHIRIQPGYPPAEMEVDWIRLEYAGRYYEDRNAMVQWDFNE